MNKKWILLLECSGIFLLIPLLLWLRIVDTPLIMIPLILICIPVTLWLGKKYGFTSTVFWAGEWKAERCQLNTIINRFLIIAFVLYMIIFSVYPLHMFDLPRNATGLWLMLMVFYPIVSVYPQELLYRTFFFRRYESLFRQPQILLLSNAFLFGWMHIVFHNYLASIFSMIAGILFADTYRRTRSLRLTCLEHTLYGYLIFTLGYGEAFLYEPWFNKFLS